MIYYCNFFVTIVLLLFHSLKGFPLHMNLAVSNRTNAGNNDKTLINRNRKLMEVSSELHIGLIDFSVGGFLFSRVTTRCSCIISLFFGGLKVKKILSIHYFLCAKVFIINIIYYGILSGSDLG